jgi:UDP-N-acetylmuramyl pentapeptide synthase
MQQGFAGVPSSDFSDQVPVLGHLQAENSRIALCIALTRGVDLNRTRRLLGERSPDPQLRGPGRAWVK